MRRAVARGAVALATLHALVVPACRGSAAPPVSAEASPGEGFDDSAPYLLPPPEGGEAFEPSGEPPPAGEVEIQVARVEKGRVPVPRPDAPSRGPRSAKVTIQIYSD